jgi:probable rRNA maturation factor
MSNIQFLGQRQGLKNIDKAVLKSTMKALCAQHDHKFIHLTFVFLNDEELLQMNKDFLLHNYYTDIITFDLSDETHNTIDGEIYISTDRVKDNAHLDPSLQIAFLRVMFHGILHLCGFKDKTAKEKAIMRQKEMQYITLYHDSLGIQPRVSRETK